MTHPTAKARRRRSRRAARQQHRCSRRLFPQPLRQIDSASDVPDECDLVTLAMIACSRVMKRLKHGAGAALILGFFSLTLLLIALKLDGLMVAVLYVWMEVIGAVVVLQSWLMTGNAFDPRQAKRLFGVIAA